MQLRKQKRNYLTNTEVEKKATDLVLLNKFYEYIFEINQTMALGLHDNIINSELLVFYYNTF